MASRAGDQPRSARPHPPRCWLVSASRYSTCAEPENRRANAQTADRRLGALVIGREARHCLAGATHDAWSALVWGWACSPPLGTAGVRIWSNGAVRNGAICAFILRSRRCPADLGRGGAGRKRVHGTPASSTFSTMPTITGECWPYWCLSSAGG